MGQQHSRCLLITPGLVVSSSWAAGLMQPCSWLQTIDRGPFRIRLSVYVARLRVDFRPILLPGSQVSTDACLRRSR